jgi:hypothetical protein
MKIFNPRTHGYVDYVNPILLLVGPTLFGLTGMPAMFAYALAIAHLVMTLVTDYPLGPVKFLPFTIHGWIEAATAPSLMVLPFVLGFSTDLAARNFYLAFSVATILVVILTDYKGAETTKAQT